MNDDIAERIRQIFGMCRELTSLTGRPFSPDGHLVGSLGEVFAREHLGLLLMQPSNLGYDAVDSHGRKVEIKSTTRSSVALSAAGTSADRLVVVQFDEHGNGRIVYDGDASAAWKAAGQPQRNGQRQISLSTLDSIAHGAADSLFD